MQIPDIEIQVFDVEGGKLLATYMNEVPDVERDRYMTFTIVNRHIVPDFAMVEWTVRNDGGDAVALGDLGHKRGGIGLLSVDEHTAYIGKHYMDCVIRCNGSVFFCATGTCLHKGWSPSTTGAGKAVLDKTEGQDVAADRSHEK